MITSHKFVIGPLGRCEVDVFTDILVFNDGGTEREPTPEEIAAHFTGRVVVAGKLVHGKPFEVVP